MLAWPRDAPTPRTRGGPRTGVLALAAAAAARRPLRRRLVLGGGRRDRRRRRRGALALLGRRVPLPRGGGVVLGSLLALAARGAGSRSLGRLRPTAPGTSSTGRSLRRLRAARPVARRAVRAASVPRRRRAARRRVRRGDRLGARGQGDPGALSRTAAGRRGCATRSATGTPSRSRPTRCSSSRSGVATSRVAPAAAPRSRRRRSPSAAVVAVLLAVSRAGLARRGRRGRAVARARRPPARARRLPRSPSPCPRSSSRPGPLRAMRSSRTDRSYSDRVARRPLVRARVRPRSRYSGCRRRSPRPLPTGRALRGAVSDGCWPARCSPRS